MLPRSRFAEDFRPVRDVHQRMLAAARSQLAQGDEAARAATLAEISLADPLPHSFTEAPAPDAPDVDDLLARLQGLAAAGVATLITDFAELFRVALYLQRYAVPRVVFVVGSHTFTRFFSDRPFEKLDGGVLEALGRLFTRSVRIALYPEAHPETGEGVSARTAPLPPTYTHLRDYLFDNEFIHELAAGPVG